jgi:hypothetical protein
MKNKLTSEFRYVNEKKLLILGGHQDFLSRLWNCKGQTHSTCRRFFVSLSKHWSIFLNLVLASENLICQFKMCNITFSIKDLTTTNSLTEPARTYLMVVLWISSWERSLPTVLSWFFSVQSETRPWTDSIVAQRFLIQFHTSLLKVFYQWRFRSDQIQVTHNFLNSCRQRAE